MLLHKDLTVRTRNKNRLHREPPIKGTHHLGFPKIRGAFLWVPLIMTIACWADIGVPLFGKLPFQLCATIVEGRSHLEFNQSRLQRCKAKSPSTRMPKWFDQHMGLPGPKYRAFIAKTQTSQIRLAVLPSERLMAPSTTEEPFTATPHFLNPYSM